MGATCPASSLVAPPGLSPAREAANVRPDHGSRTEHALSARSATYVADPESRARKFEWCVPWAQGERGKVGLRR